jgi:hypothetical protein
MSIHVTTTGESRALALAGLDGTDGGPVVHFGPGGEGADVVWREGTPWPVRDELFELAPAAERNILVVGDEPDRRELGGWLSQLDGRLLEADFLERHDLEEVAAVVFAQPDGRPLPAPAFAVLAARRILVVREPSISFGLLPSIDHLSARTAAGAAQLVTAAMLHWDAFAAVREFGRIAAERHRASTVYARLARDLEMAGRYPARAGERGSSTVTTP